MSDSSAARGAGRFEPTVESLRGYRCPEWLRDAKFGIYLHWGVYSVAERGEWYGRQMYLEGNPVYEHHCKTWGHPSEFGYKDFIPMWKAEHFDPDRLVALFKQAGARYFTPCAVHHDNFDLWNSRHHKWNSVNMGPKMDITGMWREAALKQGLRFGVTTHLARSYAWFNVNKLADTAGPYKGVPYDGADPDYADFYFEAHDDTEPRQPIDPPESWRQQWLRRMKDLIDNYRPDHMYFDGAIPFQGDEGRTGLELIAWYYNQNMSWHDGRLECVMCIKKVTEHGRYIEGVATLDIENRTADRMLPDPWQTDASIGPWGYYAGAKYKSVPCLVHQLVDIVSKNGSLLLNVPPRADGTLDEETEAILAGIGQWLEVNGEAIYETRPWRVFGEGPFQEAPKDGKPEYCAEDIRFTTKGETLYAIALGRPAGQLTIGSLGAAREGAGPVGEVRLLGCETPLTWSQDDGGLTVDVPEQVPSEHALALKSVPA